MTLQKRKCACICFVAGIVLFVLAGCATLPTANLPEFTASSLKPGSYEQKVDNFVVVLDASSSMSCGYADISKFDLAKQVLNRMNAAIPDDVPLNSSLRTYGHSSSVSPKMCVLQYELSAYRKMDFGTAIDKVAKAGGTSPLAAALKDVGGDLKTAAGKTALIIVSDGEDMGDSAITETEVLSQQLKDRLCIYTIHVGVSASGKALLESLVQKAGCGRAVNALDIASSAGMQQFVKDALLTEITDSDGDGISDKLDQCPGTQAGMQVDSKGCPMDSDGDGVFDELDRCPKTPAGVSVNANGCPKDTDGDGVSDDKDMCPGTAKGIKVNAAGCPIPAASQKVTVTEKGTWIYEGIQFDSGKFSIKPSSSVVLNEIATFLKDNPGIQLEIQGHTDDRGKVSYNNQLSDKRANAVRNYFIDQGVASNRISAKGYGPSMPIASNDTAAGRDMNRRVEFKPIQ